jgi:hypothetical protein
MTNPTTVRHRLGCGTLVGLMVAASVLTFFVLYYQLGRPKEVGTQTHSPFPILVVGLGPTPTARVIDIANLTDEASKPLIFIIPPERAASIQAALDKEMRAEEEHARLSGDDEAYRQAHFTIEKTLLGRQLIRLDYSRNGMDTIVSTTTWYDATSTGVEPRMYGRGMMNGVLIFLSVAIGSVISATIGVGWRFVRWKRG